LRCNVDPDHDVADFALTPGDDHLQQLLGIRRRRGNYGGNQFVPSDVCARAVRDFYQLVKASVDRKRPADRSLFRYGSRRYFVRVEPQARLICHGTSLGASSLVPLYLDDII
jgi:hypothetical protein